MSTRTLTAVAAGLTLLAATSAHAGLIISEVVDGTLPGGNPKFLEITNTDATDFTFLSGGIVVQSNSSTDLFVDVDLAGVTILAGQSYVIQSQDSGGQAAFYNTYGFHADLYTTAFLSNGDDRYILANAVNGSSEATSILDIHGEIDTDGTGKAWEFTDGYAFRNPGVVNGNGGVFDISEWTHGGKNSLEDSLGGDPAELILIQTHTTPGTHHVPEPASLALIGLGGLAMFRRR